MLPEADITPKNQCTSSRLVPLLPCLACPRCLGGTGEPGLALDPGGLCCVACGTVYPIRNGVPMLLTEKSLLALGREVDSATGQAMVSEYQNRAAATPHIGWLDRLRPPALMHHSNPNLDGPPTRGLFDHAGPRTRVLNVGGGPHRYSPQEITLNLDTFVNVDVVGDAHLLPFQRGTFDSVICNAVLEHVHSPELVAAEMVRVLRPGGVLYAEVPFIFFFHGYPNDFRRYTLEGMRRLFGDLHQPQFGITNGPVSAVLQSMNTLLQIMLPPDWPRTLKLLRGLFGWTLFPLKYLDRHLASRPDAHLLAGGFWVRGSKRDDAA